LGVLCSAKNVNAEVASKVVQKVTYSVTRLKKVLLFGGNVPNLAL
jgi:hypothetical protein